MKSFLFLIFTLGAMWSDSAFGQSDDSTTEANVACEDCSPRKPPSRLEKLPVEEKAAPASNDFVSSINWSQLLGGGMNLLGAFLNYRSTQNYINYQQQQQSYFSSQYRFNPYMYGNGYGSSYGSYSQAPGIISLGQSTTAPSIIPLGSAYSNYSTTYPTTYSTGVAPTILPLSP